MTILTWNICLGDEPAKKANLTECHRNKQITEAILNSKLNPDIIVLTEYMPKNGEPIKRTLESKGYKCHYHLSEGYINSYYCYVLIAVKKSKYVPEFKPVNSLLESKNLGLRWIETNLAKENLSILGVHVSIDKRKEFFWEQILHYANKKDKNTIIIGDFNTCLSSLDYSSKENPTRLSEKIQTLKDKGWIDAWRKKHPNDMEYSWNELSRLDYCFISKNLRDCLKNVEFNHAVKNDRLSDHSMLIIEFEDSFK